MASAEIAVEPRSVLIVVILLCFCSGALRTSSPVSRGLVRERFFLWSTSIAMGSGKSSDKLSD